MASDEKALEDVRCRQCRKMLLRIEPHALKPGRQLAVKCRDCNTMNYLVGDVDQQAA